MDIASSITKLRTSRLYTRKALAEKAKIDLRHLIAVEEGRAIATDNDIEAISRVFHVKPEDWNDFADANVDTDEIVFGELFRME